MRNRYQWLLFDADGTLFDYDSAETAALAETFHYYRIPYRQEYIQEYRKINGRIWRDFELGRITQETLRTSRFERLFLAINLDGMPDSFSERYLKQLSSHTELIAGVEETLHLLSSRYKMAVITNGLKDVQRPRLAGSTIGGLFSALIISEEVGFAKPDPGIFDVAFRAIGNPQRNKVLMIGDSMTSDIAGGVGYGLDTCWYNPGGLAADPVLDIRYEIGSIRQLLELLSI